MSELENAISIMKNASLEHLTDVAWLEYKLLPMLGLNDRHLNQYPLHLHPFCGDGINSWQYPCQFSKYLIYLSQQDIRSYIEIGCHKGGTFIITVEYLSRFNKIERALAVDNWHREIMDTYSKQNSAVEYLSTSSHSDDFHERLQSQEWDLILIDGDHSYDGAKADFQSVKDHGRFLAFHDIVNTFTPGVCQLWREVKEAGIASEVMEFTEQYDDVLLRIRGSLMGIGIVKVENDAEVLG